jgi:hypothetical protein
MFSAHSRPLQNPTIAAFISPRGTSLVVQQTSSAFSAPRKNRLVARDALEESNALSNAESGVSAESSPVILIR